MIKHSFWNNWNDIVDIVAKIVTIALLIHHNIVLQKLPNDFEHIIHYIQIIKQQF